MDVAIYTPGAQSGLTLSIVKSFAAPPPDFIEESDLMRERVATTATSLLGLLGIDADPIKSREHILLSTIIDACWRQGQDLDLARLIQLIQTPPVQRIGVLELEAFYPSDKRFELAMAVNNLLAAPGFSAWTEGEALDVQRLLYTPEGKPRLTILSIAHLNDAERMFFVSLLLNQVLGWMRQQPGTTSLRAIVYMDEIAGYLPPVANPASKAPMLTLLKQARAFGVGMVLATQNPVDLDYKALSNAGTWFIGRLQTERDQARVLDGLEGAMSTAGRRLRSRRAADTDCRPGQARLPAAQRPRRRPGGVRVAVGDVVPARPADADADQDADEQPQGCGCRTRHRSTQHPAPHPAPRHPAPGTSGAGVSARTPPRRLCPLGPAPRHPAVLRAGQAWRALRADDRRRGQRAVHRYESKIDETRPLTVVTPLTADPIPVNWEQAEPAAFDVGQLSTELPSGATFDELPGAASKAKNYAEWTRSFVTWVSTAESLDIFRSPSLKLVSTAGESEGDFRARLQQAARELRDAEVTRLRQKFAPKAAALQEKLRRAEQAVQKEEEQASAQKTQTAISFGTTVLGALFGRKTLERVDPWPRHHRRARRRARLEGSAGRRAREGERRVGAGADGGARRGAAGGHRLARRDLPSRHRAARDDQPQAETDGNPDAAGRAGVGGMTAAPELKFGPTYVGDNDGA